MTLASPSQQDSQHLLEERHTQRDGALLTGELPNVKPGSSPSLVGNAQTRIIIIRGQVSPIYLFSLQFLHFVFQHYRKEKGVNIPILLLSPPPRKVSKMQTMLISSQLGDSRCTHWPSPCWRKVDTPASPEPSPPVQNQGRQIVILWLGTSSHS